MEADLLSGMAGEIQNRVTDYMNRTPDTHEYWARASRSPIASDSPQTVPGR